MNRILRNPWTAFFDWYKGWISDIRSTNHIIIAGVTLAAVYVLWLLGADTFCQPPVTVCKPVTAGTQETLAWFLGAMIAGGVGQFTAKRLTDRETITAKATARATTAMPAIKEGA